MHICWTVCTYNRPELLPRIIYCFENQTYADRSMVILDDGGQYKPQEGEKWKLVVVNKRFRSLSDKRNAILDMVPPETCAVMPVDDDDLAMPYHTEATAKALENAGWSRPSVILSGRCVGDTWIFLPTYTGKKEDQTQQRLYHPAWGVRLSVMRDVGGYPRGVSCGEDQRLMQAMEQRGIAEADPIALGFSPSYVYCWGNGNISGLRTVRDSDGRRTWRHAGMRRVRAADIKPWTPPFHFSSPIIAPTIRPRPF